MDGQISIFDFIPKDSNSVRTVCLLDKTKPYNIFNAHDVAKSLGINCNYGCCNACDQFEECGARCNNASKSKSSQKSCAATLEKCDCFCGVEHCCQNCAKPCDTRCSYSIYRYEVFDQSTKQWVRNQDYFNPVWVLIAHGTGFVNGKERVRDYFTENHSKDEKIKFLKKEYGIGGFGFPHEGKKNFLHGSMSDAKGIKIEYLDKDGINHEELISWNTVEKEIAFLIGKGWYQKER